jgi:hypothetical protein
MATSILQGLGRTGADIGTGAGIISDENRQNAEAQLRQLQAKMALAEFQQKVKEFQARQAAEQQKQPASVIANIEKALGHPLTDRQKEMVLGIQGTPSKQSFQEILGPDNKPHRYQIDEASHEKTDLGIAGTTANPPQPTEYSDWRRQNPDAPVSEFMKLQKKYRGKEETGSGSPDDIAAYAEDLMARKIKVSDIPVKMRGAVLDYIRKNKMQPPRTPSAEEHRRADLAVNVNENLEQIEDIVKRRPELFGPGAGWITGARHFFGTNDPDIAALYDIKDNLGRAAQGAHGMRSARGVADAANAVLNNLKNGPKAVAAAAAASRRSVATFLKDVGETPEGDTAPDDAAPSSLDDALDSIFGKKGAKK